MRRSRLLPLLVATSLAVAAFSTVGATGASAAAAVPAVSMPTDGGTFQNPSTQAKPIVRLWFPDAGLGASAAGLAMVAQRIKSLAAAGYGGAEIAFLSDNTNYDNDDAKTIGFGTPNWKRIVTQIFKTANSIPGGFKIDLTISAHWPIALDNIDPNDDAQQQEATTAYSKITAADLATGTATLALPTQQTKDVSNTASLEANFLFVDKLSAVTVAKVTGFDGTTPIFQLSTLDDVTGKTKPITVTSAQAKSGTSYKLIDGVRYAGYAAGVPDQAAATKYGFDYSQVLAQWGPAASPSTRGKIDANGNRKRMADWQYEYQTKIAGLSELKGYRPSSGDSLAVGDYVLFGSYHRGTGQIMSGGSSVTQYARTYAVNLYDKSGVQAIKDFWNQKILDPQLIKLMKANGIKNPSDSLFEDSFEISHTNPLWSDGLLSTMNSETSYSAAKYAPLLALGASADFDDTATASRILQDYTTAMGTLWRTNHIGGLNAFAATFGWKYKVQTEGGSTGISGAETLPGVIEGDNGATDDGYRNLAAAANISGSNLLSLEGLTFETNALDTDWTTIARSVNGYFAGGVNRVLFHGSPMPVTFNGYHDSWPGWYFAFGSFAFGAYDSRQPYWQDMKQVTDYVARNQAVLQEGVAKVDVGVLEGSAQRYSLAGGTAFQNLLDAGYSYNILDESMLKLKGMTVSGRVLDARGPGYKAIVVDGASQLNVATVDTLIKYARAGLPVILYNSNITSVFGTNKPGNNDTLLAQRVAVLKSLAYSTSDATALQNELADRGATPAASYSVPGLESVHRRDGNKNFYYLYSNGTSLADAAKAGDTGIRVVDAGSIKAGQTLLLDTGANRETVTVASVDESATSGPNVTLTAALTKAHDGAPAAVGGPPTGATGAGVSFVVDSSVTLTGEGVPYTLDAYTGKVTRVAQWTRNGSTVTVPGLTLVNGDSTIIELLPSRDEVHARSTTGGTVTTVDGKLVLQAENPGTYTVSLSSGRSKTVKVASVPNAVSVNGGWSLALQSWGPDATADVTDPSISAKTWTTFANTGLGSWSDLPATADQLTALGVSSMSQVIGIGHYTAQFVLPAGWSKTVGAHLTLGHGDDQITEVAVNGRRLATNDVLTDTLVVPAGYLHAGSNVITVKVDTTLNNRITGRTSVAYGLTSATVTPFVQTGLQ